MAISKNESKFKSLLDKMESLVEAIDNVDSYIDENSEVVNDKRGLRMTPTIISLFLEQHLQAHEVTKTFLALLESMTEEFEVFNKESEESIDERIRRAMPFITPNSGLKN